MTNNEAYKAFLAEVKKETGIDAFEPDEDGLVSIAVYLTFFKLKY